MSAPASPITVAVATLAVGPAPNQDHAVVTGRAAAVLDGATSWLPQEPARDGGWYARALGAALTTRLDDDREIAVIVAESIADLRDRYRLAPGDGPLSTVTIARWDAEQVEVYTLGDSPAVVFRPGQAPTVVHDTRLEAVGYELRVAYRDHLRAGHGFDDRLAAVVAELQRAERERRNREGGYWIAESDPEAAHHAVTATYARTDVSAVLLATDGAAVDVLDYGRNHWTDVHDLAVTGNAARYLRDVHDAEDADYDGRWWPRAQRHDDKTLVVVTWSG